MRENVIANRNWMPVNTFENGYLGIVSLFSYPPDMRTTHMGLNTKSNSISMFFFLSFSNTFWYFLCCVCVCFEPLCEEYLRLLGMNGGTLLKQDDIDGWNDIIRKTSQEIYFKSVW